MRTFIVTAVINAPPDRIWPILSDVANWPRWLPTVTSVTPLDSPEMKVGARFKVVQPRLLPAVWTVTDVVDNCRFIWESHTLGMLARADHVLKPISAEATEVELRIDLHGLLSGLVAVIFGRLTRNYMQREAKSLKQQAEAAS